MLVSSRDQMLRYGRQVTMDTTEMTVHHFQFPGAAAEEPRPAVAGIGSMKAMPILANGRVTVSYQLAAVSSVRLLVFPEDCRKLVELTQGVISARRHTLNLDRALATGTYLLRLEAGVGRESPKMVMPAR